MQTLQHEEREGSEVARFARVLAHVTERVDVNQQTNAGNNDEHHFAQLIQNKSKWNDEDCVDIDPLRAGAEMFAERKSNNCK